MNSDFRYRTVEFRSILNDEVRKLTVVGDETNANCQQVNDKLLNVRATHSVLKFSKVFLKCF